MWRGEMSPRGQAAWGQLCTSLLTLRESSYSISFISCCLTPMLCVLGMGVAGAEREVNAQPLPAQGAHGQSQKHQADSQPPPLPQPESVHTESLGLQPGSALLTSSPWTFYALRVQAGVVLGCPSRWTGGYREEAERNCVVPGLEPLRPWSHLIQVRVLPIGLVGTVGGRLPQQGPGSQPPHTQTVRTAGRPGPVHLGSDIDCAPR